MRSVVLAVLAVLGIVVCLRMHFADAHHRAGRAILDSEEDRDPYAAASHFEKALAIGAEDHMYAFRRGRATLLMRESTRFEEAARWFERAARLNPAMAEIQYWWGVSLLAQGEIEREEGRREAADEFREAGFERFEVARRLGPYKIDMNQRIAKAYLERWSRTRAEDDLRRAFETLHTLRLVEPEAPAQAVESLVALRMIRYEQLDAVVPRSADERRTLGETLAAAGRYAWAIRAFDEADALGGANGELAIRGRMLKYEVDVKGYPAEALRLLEEVRELSGESFDKNLELGRVLRRLSREKEARAAFRRHLSDAETRRPEAIEEIHAAYEDVGGEENAEAEFAMWNSVAPQYTGHEARKLNYYAALASFRLGRPSVSLEWLVKYTRRARPEPHALLLQARCYHALEQPRLAEKRLRQARDLRPDDPEIRAFAVELGLEEE